MRVGYFDVKEKKCQENEGNNLKRRFKTCRPNLHLIVDMWV